MHDSMVIGPGIFGVNAFLHTPFSSCQNTGRDRTQIEEAIAAVHGDLRLASLEPFGPQLHREANGLRLHKMWIAATLPSITCCSDRSAESISIPLHNFVSAMASASRPWRPPGYPSTLSTYLMSTNAHKVIDFMTSVFNAQCSCKMMNDDNSAVKHALVTVDGCAVMLADASSEHPALPAWLYIYVEDVDQTYALALRNGAESVQPPRDEFYGDRVSAVKDMAGNTWWIATHKLVPECQGVDAKTKE